MSEQRGRAPTMPANQRIVIADDRVLHRVRQQEQDDEIERIELRQLAFAGEAESDRAETRKRRSSEGASRRSECRA